MPEFLRLPNAVVSSAGIPAIECRQYGTGGCCWDRHFDMTAVLPEANARKLCMTDEDNAPVTIDKSVVNCTECIAIMRS